MLLWDVEICPRHIPIFEAISAAGFDGVEIPLVDKNVQQLDVLANACDNLGLKRTASVFMTPEFNPISPNPAIRKAAVGNLKQRIDEALQIKATKLIGGFYQAHKYFTNKAPTHQEWQWSREVMYEAGVHAQQAGVHLAMEYLNRFEAHLINTAVDAKRMVNEIGLDNVGVLYDTHHANIEDPDPLSTLQHIRKEVSHIHLSESHRGTLGTGQVDFYATFAALREINYSGWLVIEAFGNHNSTIVPAANIWRNAFTSEQEVIESGIKFIRDRIAHGC